MSLSSLSPRLSSKLKTHILALGWKRFLVAERGPSADRPRLRTALILSCRDVEVPVYVLVVHVLLLPCKIHPSAALKTSWDSFLALTTAHSLPPINAFNRCSLALAIFRLRSFHISPPNYIRGCALPRKFYPKSCKSHLRVRKNPLPPALFFKK